MLMGKTCLLLNQSKLSFVLITMERERLYFNNKITIMKFI